jgi:hypothetical protein
MALGCRDRRAPGDGNVAPSSSPFVAPSPSPVAAEEQRSTEDAILSYLTAMSAKDCAALSRLVIHFKAAECKQDVDDWVEHHTTFLAFDGFARDGRDPSVILATARMRVEGKDLKRVFRVGSDDAGVRKVIQ